MAIPSRIVEIDGRRLRSERTRQHIIEAYLAMLREGSGIPTAAQIAERAGYSVRSLFERLTITNAAEPMARATAELGAALLLYCARNVDFYRSELRKRSNRSSLPNRRSS